MTRRWCRGLEIQRVLGTDCQREVGLELGAGESLVHWNSRLSRDPEAIERQNRVDAHAQFQALASFGGL